MRIVFPLILLGLVLAGLIGFRLHQQEKALLGPSGGSGEIEATTVELSSRLSARLVESYVEEGAHVTKDQLILRLDCSDPQAMLAEAEARLAATEAQAVAAGVQVGAAWRMQAAAKAAGDAAQAQALALDAQREAAERQAARFESIPQDVPANNIDQVRTTAVGLAHQVEAAEAQAKASGAQAVAAAVNAKASTAQAKAAKAQVDAAVASVERAKLLVKECEVRAPLDAEVSDLPFEAGELTSMGSTLVRLISLAKVTATFYLPNAELRGAKPGALAQVVADAWPNQVFRGKIRTVGLKAEFTPRNVQTRSDRDRLVYPIEVDIENPRNMLRSGMPVQVTLPGTEKHP